jgi:hypothetical protein
MKPVVLFFSVIMIISCATTYQSATYRESEVEQESATTEKSEQKSGKKPSDVNPYHAVQKKLVEGAHWARGREKLVVHGTEFRMDCTGTIMAIYYYAGIDLRTCMHGYTGNGVARMYHYFKDHGLLYKTHLPKPGDIIFWDDSYDKNEDGKANDGLTHMGMVVAVSGEGDITYVHHNYRKGIVFAQMNLLDPDNPERNAPMRMRSLGHTPDGRWLSSHLYRENGQGYKMDVTVTTD